MAVRFRQKTKGKREREKGFTFSQPKLASPEKGARRPESEPFFLCLRHRSSAPQWWSAAADWVKPKKKQTSNVGGEGGVREFLGRERKSCCWKGEKEKLKKRIRCAAAKEGVREKVKWMMIGKGGVTSNI